MFIKTLIFTTALLTGFGLNCMVEQEHTRQRGQELFLAGLAAENAGKTVEAYENYMASAYTGFVRSQNKMGEFFKNRANAEINLSQKAIHLNAARDWHLKAYEQGDVDAGWYIGVLYDEARKDVLDPQGKQVLKNEARTWFLRAAERGHRSSAYELGMLAKAEKHKTQDSQKKQELSAQAFAWFSKAAELGDKDAQFELGLIYKNMSLSSLASPAHRYYWYIQARDEFCLAAMQNHHQAQFELGVCYSEESDSTHDISQKRRLLQQAYSWLVAASKTSLFEHYSRAPYELSKLLKKLSMYVEAPQNDILLGEACQWLQKAAELGHYEAQRELHALFT